MVTKSPTTTVTHKKYGNHHVVHLANGEHGSLALHSNEHNKIKSLKDGEHHKFKGEDGTRYIAKRKDSNIHITDHDGKNGEDDGITGIHYNFHRSKLNESMDLKGKILDRLNEAKIELSENTIVYNNTEENRKKLGLHRVPEYVKGDNTSKYFTHDLKKGEFRFHNKLPEGKKIRN